MRVFVRVRESSSSRNWFHLAIECSWRAVFCVFAAGYFGSWIFFGFVYYVIELHTRAEVSLLKLHKTRHPLKTSERS